LSYTFPSIIFIPIAATTPMATAINIFDFPLMPPSCTTAALDEFASRLRVASVRTNSWACRFAELRIGPSAKASGADAREMINVNNTVRFIMSPFPGP
jgi:hypothetical protein